MFKKVSDNPEKLRLVHDEVDKHRDMLAPRVRSIQTRAAILIGAAGIALAFLAAADPRTCLNWVSIVMSLGAAGCGIAAMVSVGQKGKEVWLPEFLCNTMAAADAYRADRSGGRREGRAGTPTARKRDHGPEHLRPPVA